MLALMIILGNFNIYGYYMYKQFLSDAERKTIRSDLYLTGSPESSDLSDAKIAFFVKWTKNKRVLDLGCVDHSEENWMSRYWLHKAICMSSSHTIGLDYYGKGVSELQKLGFNVIEGDAQDFSFDEKFDVVTAGDLIEHLPNLDGFFKSIFNVLDDQGLLLLTTPNPWCWKYLAYHLAYKKLDKVNGEHVSWFCLQTISNLSRRYGFEVVEHEYSSRRFYEKVIPLPAHLKHTTLNLVLKKL